MRFCSLEDTLIAGNEHVTFYIIFAPMSYLPVSLCLPLCVCLSLYSPCGSDAHTALARRHESSRAAESRSLAGGWASTAPLDSSHSAMDPPGSIDGISGMPAPPGSFVRPVCLSLSLSMQEGLWHYVSVCLSDCVSVHRTYDQPSRRRSHQL